MFQSRTHKMMRLACETRGEDAVQGEVSHRAAMSLSDDAIGMEMGQISDSSDLEMSAAGVICPVTGIFKVPKRKLCEITGKWKDNDDEEDIDEGELVLERGDVSGNSSHMLGDQSHRTLCDITGEWVSVEDGEPISDDEDASGKARLKKNQQRRILGQKYVGFKKQNGTYKHCDPKPEKKMRARCNHNASKKIMPNSFCCHAVNDDDRKVVFDKFWALQTWPEKKAYFYGITSTRNVKRRRSNISESALKAKLCGHDYFLPTIAGRRYKVCLIMFINTLAISQSMVTRWCISQKAGLASESDENVPPRSVHKKTQQSVQNKENMKKWLDLVPKVPSHYCRQNTTRRYVDASFTSMNQMLSIYNLWCDESNLPKVNRNIFNKFLKDENVSIHHPRKDQCDLCIGFNQGAIEQGVYDAHMRRKEQAKKAKIDAKNLASDTTLVLTMDLQSVLSCPKLLASAVYYKQKLQVHNFTIYVLNNADVTLYTWHESDGGVTANEFTSCIINYVQNLPQNYKKIILISDGCNGQNRNKVLASALSDHAKTRNVVLEQIYLEKGHTMMEADNVHSVLEHYFKPPIYSPADYITRMKLARPKQPYNVINIHYDFFSNYECLPSNLPSLRPGKKVGDPVVTDLRALRYLPTGEIQYKIDHTTDWLDLPQRRKNGRFDGPPPPLYNSLIPLSYSKHKHLQELKTVVDKDHHPFYDNLPFVPS